MNITNITGLPQVIVDAIVNDDYDHDNKDDNTYSATDIINPVCYTELNRRYGKYTEEDASDRIWSLLGQATHSVMERAKSKDRIFEERLYSKIGNYTVSGKPDMYEVKDCILYDFKITSAWTVMFKCRIEEWTEQLNVYAKLLREQGHDVKGIKIIAILRDWSKLKASTEIEYPKQQVQVLDLELWEEEEQELFILEKLNERVEARDIHDDNLKPCSMKERWQDPTKYAVMKGKNKRATKVCDKEKEAWEYIKYQDKSTDYTVKERPSVPKRCLEYCKVNKHCRFYKDYMGIDDIPFSEVPKQIEEEEDIF